MNSVRNAPNPMAALQSIVQQNPNYQNIMNYINQNGGDPKTAFYNLAQEKGIDPTQITRMLNLR